MTRIEASAPASTANLGPGFDALAAALELRNRFVLETGRAGTERTGIAAPELGQPGRDLFRRAFRAAFRERGERAPEFSLCTEVAIPVGSGLGSSASAIAAGISAANLLLREPLEPAGALRLACRLDGHPDNVAAALFGGVTLAGVDGARVIWRRLPAPPLRAVVWLPDLRRSTRAVRRELPRRVPRADAVHSLAHAALVFHGFAAHDWELVGQASMDRLHEPHRLPRIPGALQARAAASAAGAISVTLSGSGPAVLALCQEHTADTVADAMRQVRAGDGPVEVRVLGFTGRGARARPRP